MAPVTKARIEPSAMSSTAPRNSFGFSSLNVCRFAGESGSFLRCDERF